MKHKLALIQHIINIATFNIKDDFNNYLGGISKALNRPLLYSKIIKENNIDIIATQEMTYKFTKNLKKYLDKYSFNGKYRFSNFLKHIPFNENNMIIANKSILFNKNYILPGRSKIISSIKNKSIYKRLANVLLIEEKGKKICIINTHLASSSQVIKDIQIESLYKIICEHNDSPVILMGDFNMSSSNKTFKLFTEKLEGINIKEIKMKSPTYGNKKLDHIFLSDNIKVLESKIIDCKDLSDHNGILAKISIN